MSGGSTDVEALTRGFRSRLFVLGVVVVAGLAAAVWSETREQGIGEAEDRRRVMVVAASDTDYYAVLERGGFVVEVDSMADWEAAARAERPDSEAEGVALLVELADARGVGFIVLEAPATLELGELELEPAPADIEGWDQRDYAAISVGDLAFPSRLSVDEAGDDPLLRLPGYGALQALFGQPAVTAREDEARPTVEELQHEDKIERGRWMVERPQTFTTALAYARESIAANLAKDPGAHTLVGPFVTGTAVPTPEGGALVVHHELEAYSEDARALELHAGSRMRLDYLSPEALARLVAGGEPELEACPSLAGGELELERRPRLEVAVDGSALAIGTPAGEVAIWHKLPGPGCEWREVAALPLAPGSAIGVLAPRVEAVGPAEGAGQMLLAEVGHGDGHGSVRVWIGGGASAATGMSERGVDEVSAEAVELLSLPDARFGALTFVDARHLAALARTPLPPEERTTTIQAAHAVHVLDRERPGAHLRVPTDFFAQGRALGELALLESHEVGGAGEAGGEHGPRLVLTTIDGEGRVEPIILTLAAPAWQAFVDGDPSEPSELGLVTVTPADLHVEALAVAGVSSLVTSSTGAVAYAVSDAGLPTQLGLVDARADAPARLLTRNDWVDGLPRFFADGRHLSFVTLVRTSLSPVPYSVPRIVAVDPQ